MEATFYSNAKTKFSEHLLIVSYRKNGLDRFGGHFQTCQTFLSDMN